MRLSYTPPPGWDFSTIGDLAKPEKGSIRIGPFGSALKKHEYSETGVRVLGIEDVHPNQFLSDRCKYIPDAKFCELRQYEVSHGDVLVTNMGTVGRACVVPVGTQMSIISSHLIKVSLDRSRADPNYLCWMLNYSPLVVAQIRAKSHGAIMAGFNSSLLKSLRIPLPPLAEQKRIAGILDAADALRAKRREALAQLDTLLQSTFLDMFGDPVTNPMDWEVATVSRIGSIQGGLQVTSKRRSLPMERPYLRVANVFRGFLDLGEIKTIRLTESELVRTSLDHEDILIVEGHGNKTEIGRCARWDGSIDECVHQNHLIRLRCDRSKASPIYVEHFINSPGGRRNLIGTSRTTSGLNTISVSKVCGSEIQLPPLDLQHRFAAIVESVERQETRQRAYVAELDKLFASLQSRAFRGDL